MSLNHVLRYAAELGVAISSNAGNLRLTGPQFAIQEIASLAKPHKPELLKIVDGQVVDDVGRCDKCSSDLVGLRTFDGYINRVCPECGRWFRCLPPENSGKNTVKRNQG